MSLKLQAACLALCAGMLALPSVTAPAGFGPTAALMVALWGLLTMEARLIAEVNLAVGAATLPASHPLRSGEFAAAGAAAGADASKGPTTDVGDDEQQGHGRIVTLRQMAEFTLGDAGKGKERGAAGVGVEALWPLPSSVICFL